MEGRIPLPMSLLFALEKRPWRQDTFGDISFSNGQFVCSRRRYHCQDPCLRHWMDRLSLFLLFKVITFDFCFLLFLIPVVKKFIMATSTNSEIVNLAASGMRRAISIRTPRQAYHPLATMTSSRLRYPTGCWVGPNS